MIQIKITNQSFSGAHEPLISGALFRRVQDVLHGKTNTHTNRHDFLFRRRLACKSCCRTLIGETHKGFVYYRCQIPQCPTTAIREEVAEKSFLEKFLALRLSSLKQRYCWQEVRKFRTDHHRHSQEIISSLKLNLGQLDDRLSRITDAYIDRLIDKDTFEQRKTALLAERLKTTEGLVSWQNGKRNVADVVLEIRLSAGIRQSAIWRRLGPV